MKLFDLGKPLSDSKEDKEEYSYKAMNVFGFIIHQDDVENKIHSLNSSVVNFNLLVKQIADRSCNLESKLVALENL